MWLRWVSFCLWLRWDQLWVWDKEWRTTKGHISSSAELAASLIGSSVAVGCFPWFKSGFGYFVPQSFWESRQLHDELHFSSLQKTAQPRFQEVFTQLTAAFMFPPYSREYFPPNCQLRIQQFNLLAASYWCVFFLLFFFIFFLLELFPSVIKTAALTTHH